MVSVHQFIHRLPAAALLLAVVSASPAADAGEIEPLPLSAVRLTGGPLKHAQDLDHRYLLELEPDRMMAYMRERAGLEPKAEPYGGWDGAGRQLTGHIAGHYLSAVSLMYAATGDEVLKLRANYLVDEMKAVQEARGTGYIGALLGNDRRRGNGAATEGESDLVDGETLFGRIAKGTIESGGFDLNGMWAPWYVQHKLIAGLRDAYRFTGNDEALQVEVRLAEWCESVVGGLTDEQAQQMLRTEFGGMNEVLVDLYADTGDDRWLTLSQTFRDDTLIDPIAAGDNVLPGKHGNTQVPKFVGSLDRYRQTGDEVAGDAARNFWQFVVDDHTFATGGHGYDEYFGPADALSGQVDGTGQRSQSLRTAESCNVYNMLKLTRGLFAVEPRVEYADFHERALLNHVLSSIHPDRGDVCYMVPVGPGVTHEYSGKFDSFTCCVGTGMESHALHGDGIYHVDGAERLWVSLYASSTARWDEADVTLEVETDMPLGDDATIRLAMDDPKAFALSLRRPAWAGDGFEVSVNGEPIEDLGAPGSFVDLDRDWNDGDTIEVTLPHSLRVERLEDNSDRVAIFYGPLVLAGDFGAGDRRERLEQFPTFSHAGEPIGEWLDPVEGEAGVYTAGLANGETVTLQPFYTLHDHRYSIYFDLLSEDAWAKRQAEHEAEEAQRRRIEARTIAYVQLGQMQPERDYNFRDDPANPTEPFRDHGEPGRRGGKWLAIDVPLEGVSASKISVIMDGRSPAENLIVTADDRRLEDPEREAAEGSSVATLSYPLPDPAAGDLMTIQIRVPDGDALPAIYGIRVLRKDESAR